MEECIVKFNYEIGTIFHNNNGDIIVTDRETRLEKVIKKNRSFMSNSKWYKYTCNECGWTEGWTLEKNLKRGSGCNCCAGHTVVEGINSIVDTAPWMIPYFQGGIEEAKLYTKWGGGNPNNKGGYIYPICPDCSRVKNKKIWIGNIFKIYSIGCDCSDKISYPEKFMHSILEQLNIDFQIQLTKTTFDWCGKYKYDFYFEYNDEQYIIETHGRQHYEENTNWKMKLEEEQENDRLKKELALANGIKKENYIVIDCRYSELGFIKQNILESILDEIFDLIEIDWLKCVEYALSNIIKSTCECKNNNPNLTTDEISKIMNLNVQVVRKYLNKGTEIGWCLYNPKQERRNNWILNRNKIQVFKDNISLGIFESVKYLEEHSEELFGIKLDSGNISKVCNGKREHTQGLTFKYTVESK